MEKLSTTRILEKILLPLNTDWEVFCVETNERLEEIYVELRYRFDYVELNGVRYPVYDYRKVRKWRHLDLWQYKSFLSARLPRYKDDNGNFKTISIPWAEEYERITELLEKKR